MAYTALKYRGGTVGDIEVNYDSDHVQICVDDRVVLFIGRQYDEGLDQLATILQELVTYPKA